MILTYDIKEDKLRGDFSKFILGYGRRLQYSVYEIKNSQRILDLVKVEIEDKFEKRFSQSDSVLIFQVTSNKQIMRFGYGKNDEEDLLIF
jgi:CRISPR-associated protein Cas2